MKTPRSESRRQTPRKLPVRVASAGARSVPRVITRPDERPFAIPASAPPAYRSTHAAMRRDDGTGSDITESPTTNSIMDAMPDRARPRARSRGVIAVAPAAAFDHLFASMIRPLRGEHIRSSRLEKATTIPTSRAGIFAKP